MLAPAATATPGAQTNINLLKDQYVAKEKLRRDLIRSNPDALPRKSRLGVHSFLGLKYCVTSFADYATKQAMITTLDDPTQLEQLLLGYRQFLEGQMIAGKISPSTVNARVVYITPFFKWAWKGRHITDMPRVLDEVTKKYSPKPSAKPLSLTVVKKLWEAADGRMRTWIALAINCGLYGIEIGSLQGQHLCGEYIAKRRNKTGCPYRLKLWPMTQRLIKKHRDTTGAEEFLFLTKQGFPLVHNSLESKSNALSQAFEKLVEKAGVTATWGQFRDTSATMIEQIATSGKGKVDRGLAVQFLAHMDTRTARFYINTDPKTLPTAKLNRAIDKLGKLYGLSDETTPAAK